MTEIPDQHYRYVGNVSDELQQEFEEWLVSDYHREQITEAIGEELPFTETQRQQFDEVVTATTQYYKDRHGIDISSRLPSIENIHLLSEQNFKAMLQRRGTYHESIDVYGFQVGAKDMVLRETGDPGMTVYMIQHETEHIIGRRILRMLQTEEGIEPLELRRGFEGGNQAHGSKAMEEYTAEASTRDIITNYWPRFSSLRDLQPQFVAHEGAMHLGEVIADATGVGSERMLHELQAAHLAGNMQPIEGVMSEVERTWGKGMNRELATITSVRAGELAVRLDQHQ